MARKGTLAALFCLILALGALFAAPASAHHKEGHSIGNGGKAAGEPDGDADSDSATGYTEDNDQNDGGTPNNEPDAGDNLHPSGKDKSVEHGNSGNQGNSESDPDDDGHGPDRSNGGPDKPNGSGGEDLADQDGNNGCGNDDDFEDDNEGWCGGKPKDKSDKPDPEPVDGEDEGKENPIDDAVEGGDDETCGEASGKPCDEVEDAGVSRKNPIVHVDATLGDAVLGAVEERDAGEAPALRERPATAVEGTEEGAALPFTGQSIGGLLLGALAAIAAGALILRYRRSH